MTICFLKTNRRCSVFLAWYLKCLKIMLTLLLCSSCAKRIFKRCLCSWLVRCWSFSVDKVKLRWISPRSFCFLVSGFSRFHQPLTPLAGMFFKGISTLPRSSWEFLPVVACRVSFMNFLSPRPSRTWLILLSFSFTDSSGLKSQTSTLRQSCSTLLTSLEQHH